MEITYLGHSAFRLRGKDVSIVSDPFPPSLGLAMGKPSANIVTVSHDSANHSYVKGVGGEPRVIDGPGEYEVSNVLIAGVATSMEPMTGPTNTAYVLRFDDLAICHLGDAHDKLTNQQIEQIGDIHVLLIPVGGGKSLSPVQASDVVAQLEPQLIVPMHFRLAGAEMDGLEPVDHFTREMGVKEFVPEAKLMVTKSSIGHETRVIVLESRRV
ncbi:MAG: MBL fold metallo-hydrolase [Chloroflexota bacterium]|nr:MAG: lactamase [Chloroflexota bacterium]